MRRVTKEGQALIEHHEGVRLKKYRDVAGYWTIGIGHLIKPGEKFPPSGITIEHARELLRQDLRIAESAVSRLITEPLHDMQFDALVSFTFNLGSGALQRSTLRRKINGGYHEEAPAEFDKWVFAGGRKWKGLINRRADEGDLYEMGTELATRGRVVIPLPIEKPARGFFSRLFAGGGPAADHPVSFA